MWNLSKLSYFSDWIVIPILGLFAILADVSYHGVTPAALPFAFLGGLLWLAVEYAAHRWIFHRAYRKEHFLHHIRPAALVGVPAWQTGLLFGVFLVACWSSLGVDKGGGLFIGFAATYLWYISVHYRLHHGRPIRQGGYLHRRWLAHEAHHRSGKEVNFGVVTSLGDVLLETTP